MVRAYKRLMEKGINPYLILVSGTQDYSLVLAGLEMNCIDFVMYTFQFLCKYKFIFVDEYGTIIAF